MSLSALFKTAAVTVGVTPTPLTAGLTQGGTYPQRTAVKNVSAVTVYVGGADATTASGYPLAAGEGVTLDDTAGGLYGVVATGTAECRVLERA